MSDDRAAPRFGPAGLAESFKPMGYKKMAEVVAWLKRFGLSAFEYQGGHGVRVNPETAGVIKREAEAADVALSFHAPYYISMSGLVEATRLKSVDYLMQSAAAVRMLGGRRVIFHCGSAGRQGRGQALALARDTLARARAALDEAGFEDICLCPETMGKLNQLGTLDEVLALCRDDKRHIPCVDLGHLNAREQGALKTRADFARVAAAIGDALGDERAKRFHAHFSKIEYTAAGEKRHLTFRDRTFGPPFEPFVELCAEEGLCPVVICESAGTQAEDAQRMMKYYKKYNRKVLLQNKEADGDAE